MPIKVEQVSRLPEPQDKEDLIKIYTDATQRVLDAHTPSDLVEFLLDKQDFNLFAARFNNRLLGAACLYPWKDGMRMRYLCVRRVTRRRGVGIRLLEEMVSATDRPIHVEMPQNTTTDLLFDRAGFTKLRAEEGQAHWLYPR